MFRRAVVLSCFVLLVHSGNTASSQSAVESAQVPIVTAEHEEWYLSGEPITYDGNFYHRSGPLTAFNRNEMVRSGFYRGIPLYTRTTYEPHSVVFVPLPGGFLQPYQRRRAGEIGGTIGSIGPGLPVERGDTSRALTSALQAAGPPTNLPDTPTGRNPNIGAEAPAVVGTIGESPPAPPAITDRSASPPTAVGTGGRAVVLPRPRPLITAVEPSGVNGVFVEFNDARWYGGSAVERDPVSAFERIGEYRGFPVYVRPGDSNTIYIPVTNNGHLVTPYTRR